MSLTIKRTGASDYGRFIKALIFGEPGSGKTLISSTFPNPLYASAEGGLMSIADRDIPYVEIHSMEDMLGIKNTVSQEPKVREEILGFPVDTIVIDTLDEVQQIMMADRLRSQRSKSFEQKDWGWLLDQMRAMVRGFRNLPIHVVFTCHLKEVSDDTQRVWNKPALQGSIADGIAGYVDLSLLLQSNLVNETVNGKLQRVEKRTLLTAPSPKFPFLKDRSGKLPTEMDVNFSDDFDRIYDLIFAHVDLKEGAEYEVSTPGEKPEEVVEEAPEDKPVVVDGVEKVADTKPVAVKPAESPVKEAPKLEEPTAKQPNKLPDGVEPVNRGFGIDVYCVVCGNELESQKRVQLSKARLRKMCCDECYKSEIDKKNNKESK
jgi:hypothetical protein